MLIKTDLSIETYVPTVSVLELPDVDELQMFPPVQ